ncbi:MAG: hypothetical protein COZ16_13320 [Flavobacteriaceae bacterium CG_4_10_14_3_um_filter_31_253]|nr:MAG: hypothetical protein AUK46_13230 [Flavobacteriaceae bacterium CG2_30_31_66]PIV95280.1 MAG: hypothetical protein COW43_14145 [Flavobacteriaceae bacterium CG17_big_fil_post_rev_8_21_14_2_50_31_13]PIY13611.1 MAG: hypothetical protein COZ16_13320 [Flavobacteriaceae bacterium CG_4_10_14_3_um_filter_31_253]PIZ11828.1 MAG: hypothetical protein COY55_03125 [Flavobacteriaceae bacterium CG_4_10_14_0_8_um_filter_31_99]PJC08977.1 MAG: hypothetical protein CO067_11970 [Flavobacteriaceae bacterium CG
MLQNSNRSFSVQIYGFNFGFISEVYTMREISNWRGFFEVSDRISDISLAILSQLLPVEILYESAFQLLICLSKP